MVKILMFAAEWLVPVVGDIVENVQSKDGGVGRFLTVKYVKQVTRLVVALVILYLIIKGEASIEDLDQIKGL
jgi:hypothetical protein